MGTHLSRCIEVGQVSKKVFIEVLSRGPTGIIDLKDFLIEVVDTLVHVFIRYSATP
jgi:hypothetical protein